MTTRPVPAGLMSQLREAVRREGAALHVLSGEEADTLITIAHQADAAQSGDRAYRAELGRWTTADPARRDGVPASAFGAAPGPEQVPQRDFTQGGVAVDRQEEAFEAAPTLARGDHGCRHGRGLGCVRGRRCNVCYWWRPPTGCGLGFSPNPWSCRTP